MEINFHVLQIEFEFRYVPSIFGEITGLVLSKFQRWNSFPDFFPKCLQILTRFLAWKLISMFYRSSVSLVTFHRFLVKIRPWTFCKFQISNSFLDFFSKYLQKIDLIFGMEVNYHVLHIEFEFRYPPLIFGKITGLGLSKFQRWNSFSDFFLNACRYWPDFWHVSQSLWFTDQVWVSLHSIDFWPNYGPWTQ